MLRYKFSISISPPIYGEGNAEYISTDFYAESPEAAKDYAENWAKLRFDTNFTHDWSTVELSYQTRWLRKHWSGSCCLEPIEDEGGIL